MGGVLVSRLGVGESVLLCCESLGLVEGVGDWVLVLVSWESGGKGRPVSIGAKRGN